MKETFVVNRESIREKCLEAYDLFDHWHIRSDDRDDMVLAIDEALTNVYEHGYRGRLVEECSVSIEIFKGVRDVYIVIADYAKQFSIENVEIPNKATYIESDQIGGFGVYIIKKIMSNVRAIRLFDENVLIMQKSIHYIRDKIVQVDIHDMIIEKRMQKEHKYKLFNSFST